MTGPPKARLRLALLLAGVLGLLSPVTVAAASRLPTVRICVSEGRSALSLTSEVGLSVRPTGTSVARELPVGTSLFCVWDGAKVLVSAQGMPQLSAVAASPEASVGASIAEAPGSEPALSTATGSASDPPVPAEPSEVVASREWVTGPYDGIVVQSRDGAVSLSGARYRGILEVVPARTGLRVINQLPLEEYLYGVVPCEMYPSWPLEALKAQAVAARTYALANLLKHASEGYNLCATTHCQVYRGMQSENPRTTAAVNDTAGTVATYGSRPINAQFHSSSGGMTEDAKVVWGGALVYLRPVESTEIGCPQSSWVVDMAASDVTGRFSRAGFKLGAILDIVPLSVGSSGRISLAQVRGSSGSAEVRGERLRSILGLRSTLFYVTVSRGGANPSLRVAGETAAPPLPSAQLSASPLPNSRATASLPLEAPTAYRFTGRGYGHGVGMSQWGARTKADQGYTFDMILRHYYQGIELESW